MPENERYLESRGPYWGAEFEELCRGHRAYVLRPWDGSHEEIDLHRDPEGNLVGEPPDPEECYLCRKRANEHGYGLHGVSVHGCPNCGSEVQREQSKGPASTLNYTRCYTCVPPFPTLGKPVRLAARLLRRVLP